MSPRTGKVGWISGAQSRLTPVATARLERIPICNTVEKSEMKGKMQQHGSSQCPGERAYRIGPRLSEPQRAEQGTGPCFESKSFGCADVLRLGEPRAGSARIHSKVSRRPLLWLGCLIPLLVSCETQHHLVLETVGPPSSGV